MSYHYTSNTSQNTTITTKKITSFVINDTDLQAAASNRKLIINGTPGARCALFISNEDPKYYSNTSDTFITTETKINIEIPSNGVYEKMIYFPVVTDDDQYDFQLIANIHHNTELSSYFSNNPVYYKKSISQKTNRVLTVAVATTTTGDFQTMPTSVTVTKPASSIVNETSEIDWTIKAVDAVTGGALALTRQPVPSDFKFSVTHESVGAGTASDATTSPTILFLNSVDNLAIGMALFSIESSSVAGSPVISSIDIAKKQVTLSVAQTWVTAKDITFKGSCGTPQLSKAHDTNVNFAEMIATLTPTTATVTPAIEGATDIVVDNSYGIKVGSKYTGINVNNETEQVVTGVSYGSNSFSTTSAQTLKNNTILTFTGSSREAIIKTKLIVTKMPKENLTLTLDLDSILTSSPT